jgi:hypothetical protein
MGLFAVIGPSRNEYRSGDASLRLRYFSTIPSRCHQASSSRSNAGKSGRLSTERILSLITAMNQFSLEQLRCPAALRDRQSARPQFRGRANPRYHLSCPPLPGTPSQPDRRLLAPAGRPRYRADPGAPRRTLAVQAPAQGRYPRESERPGFHRPGLAVRGLGRAWSPSLPTAGIVPTILQVSQSAESGNGELAYH